MVFKKQRTVSFKRVHIVVEGRVQGVCFRMYTRDQAVRLNIRGCVRNRQDRTVEIIAEGEESALCKLVQWCHSGPSYATVRNVRHEYSDAVNEFNDFTITG